MDPSLLIGRKVFITSPDGISSDFVIKDVNKEGIYIHPENDESLVSMILLDKDYPNNMKIWGTDEKYNISLRNDSVLQEERTRQLKSNPDLINTETEQSVSFKSDKKKGGYDIGCNYLIEIGLGDILESLPKKSGFLQYALNRIERSKQIEKSMSLVFKDDGIYRGDEWYNNVPTILMEFIAYEIGVEEIDKKSRSQILREIFDRYGNIMTLTEYFLKPVSSNYVCVMARNTRDVISKLPEWLKSEYIEELRNYFEHPEFKCYYGVCSCLALAETHISKIYGKHVKRNLIGSYPVDEFLINYEKGEYPSDIAINIHFDVSEMYLDHTLTILELKDPDTFRSRFFVCQSYIYQYAVEIYELQKDEVIYYIERISNLSKIKDEQIFKDEYWDLFRAEIPKIDPSEEWEEYPIVELYNFY